MTMIFQAQFIGLVYTVPWHSLAISKNVQHSNGLCYHQAGRVGGPEAQPESSRTLSEGMGWCSFLSRFTLICCAGAGPDAGSGSDCRANFHVVSLYDKTTEDGEEFVQLPGEASLGCQTPCPVLTWAGPELQGRARTSSGAVWSRSLRPSSEPRS